MKFWNCLLALLCCPILSSAAQSCGDESFICWLDKKVIVIDKLCDGKHDCLNGEDESSSVCNYCPDKFHCNRNPNRVECVDKSLLCNGVRDCLYGEDESARYSGCNKTCTRDEKAAAKAGRPNCRKICTSDRDCKGPTKRCLCDYECGMSCVNIGKTCSRLQNIRNLESIRYVKWTVHRYLEAKEPFDYDVEAHHKCKPGYEAWPIHVRLCHGRGSGDGDWTKPIVCAPACSRKNLSQSDEENLKCGIKCITDVDCPVGLTCACDGPCGRTCVETKAECPDAPSVENARIEYTGEKFARVAQYICKEGMYPTGVRNCRASGEWDGVPVQCKKVVCGNPACSIAATRGHIVNNSPPPYYYKTTLRFACAKGQRLVGSSERTCMANGLWSGRHTVCHDLDIVDGERCPHPGVPIDGYILGRYTEESFNIGKEIAFRCNEGFIMNGDAVQVCLAHKKWSGGGAPLCIDSLFKTLPSSIINIFNQDTSNISDVPNSQTKKGLIEINEPGRIEIYFLIDLSMSICRDHLINSLAFAKGLVKRLDRTVSEKDKVKYGIGVFATKSKLVLDVLHLPSATPEEVLEILENIELDIERLRDQIGRTTNIEGALRMIYENQISLSFGFGDKLRVKRHCFVLTDGEIHQNDNPENTRKTIERAFAENPPEFYSIISSKEPPTSKILNQLKNVASHHQNVIYVADFYKLNEYIDGITDAREDYSICGQADNVGEHRKLAQLGRVAGGTAANPKAWPWQVLIHLFDKDIVTSFHKDNILGGGSLINSKWVLTTAHVFWILDDGSDFWHENVVLSIGITRRPTTYNELEGSVEMYQPEKIYMHKDFVNFIYRNDIALIKIGGIYTTDRKHINVPTAWPGNVTFTPYIRPVCLPCSPDSCVAKVLMSPDQKGNVFLTGEEEPDERCKIESDYIMGTEKAEMGAFVTGFGHNETWKQGDHFRQIVTKQLQQGLLKIEKNEECEDGVEKINREKIDGNHVFDDKMFCARSAGVVRGKISDACKGDGGDPLVREVMDENTKSSCFVQIGIVSWGHGCADLTEKDFEDYTYPGYYVKVTAFTSWIQATMKNHKSEEGR